MGKNRNKEISTALYKRLEPLRPAAKPSPKGGRPRLSDELALTDILAAFGKLRTRFERRIDVHVALLSLACCIIYGRNLLPFC